MIILDVALWRRSLGTFLRILLLLIVVGLVLPRLGAMLGELLSLQQPPTGPELRFQNNVRRVLGFHRVSASPVMQRLEQWFGGVLVELRKYYYHGLAN